jgi:hypothetical protein
MASLLFKINGASPSAETNKRQSVRLSCGFCKVQRQVQPMFRKYEECWTIQTLEARDSRDSDTGWFLV